MDPFSRVDAYWADAPNAGPKGNMLVSRNSMEAPGHPMGRAGQSWARQAHESLYCYVRTDVNNDSSYAHDYTFYVRTYVRTYARRVAALFYLIRALLMFGMCRLGLSDL